MFKIIYFTIPVNVFTLLGDFKHIIVNECNYFPLTLYYYKYYCILYNILLYKTLKLPNPTRQTKKINS